MMLDSLRVVDMVFCLYGILLVIPRMVVDLLACCKGCFVVVIFGMKFPCALGGVFGERNAQNFEGCKKF